MDKNLNEWMMYHSSVWFVLLSLIGVGGWVLTRSKYAWSLVGAALITALATFVLPKLSIEMAFFVVVYAAAVLITWFVAKRQDAASDSRDEVPAQ